MIRRQVVLRPRAIADLEHLQDWITQSAGPQTAAAFVARIQSHILGLDIASERGTSRDDIRPGVRILGFERKITIAFHVSDQRVTILRIFYGGRNWGRILLSD
ncbi:type II toxin-antitoxin system RelE/ParE family toxin [Segnochrobactraceae bacterium EtOH-i3]